jgi:hypothetical protein
MAGRDTAIGTRPAGGCLQRPLDRALCALEDKRGHRRVLVSTDIHIFTREQHPRGSWKRSVAAWTRRTLM